MHEPSTTDQRLTAGQRFINFLKNRQTIGFLISVAIMAVIAIAFFYPDNFEGNDLRQQDMVQGMANGEEARAFNEATGEQTWWTNSLFAGMPTFQISPSYPSNALFAWVTKVYGLGLPAPSNLLFMMMLGFMILMMTLRVRWEYGLIGAIAWGLSTYFIILIGAGHIWKFVTLAYIPPTIGGIMLAYRGRYLAGGALTAFFAMMQLSANHIQMTYYFGFVIAILVIAYLIYAIRNHTARNWVKATAALAAAGALAICANLPNLYHTSKYAKETQREQSEIAVSDPAKADAEKRAFITQYSYGRSETFTLFIPDVRGGASARPEKGNMVPMSLSELDGAKEYSSDPYVDYYLQVSRQYFGEPESTNGPVYAGVIIFALFIVGCVIIKGPVKYGLLFILILTVMLSWGRNCQWLTDLFIDWVPMYSKFRTVESILVVAEFIIPLMAVIGLYKLITGRSAIYGNDTPAAENASRFEKLARIPGAPAVSKKTDIAIIAGFGIVALICLLGALSPKIFGPGLNMQNEIDNSNYVAQMLAYQGYPEDVISMVSINNPNVARAVENLHFSMVSSDCIRSLIYLLLGFGAVCIWRFNLLKKQSMSSKVAVAAIGLFVFADLYTVNKRYLSHDSFFIPDLSASSATISPTPVDSDILTDTDPNYRVADFDRFSDAKPSYFHKMIGGYHAAKLGRYNDLINSGLLFDDANNFMNNLMTMQQDSTGSATLAATPLLDMLNVRYVVFQGQKFTNPYALGNAWFVDEIRYVDNAGNELNATSMIMPEQTAVADKSMQAILGQAAPGAPGDYIRETSYAPNRLEYESHAATDRLAVFSEIYFPWGWEATIDGNQAQIGRVNYLLRAIRIPAGDHRIVMTFDPASVHTTSTVATIAIILIYLTAVAAIAACFIPCCKKHK